MVIGPRPLQWRPDAGSEKSRSPRIAGFGMWEIRDLARLGTNEIAAIEAKAMGMANNLEGGYRALGLSDADRDLLGAKLVLDPPVLTDVPLNVATIRACYQPVGRNIVLTGTTWHTDQEPSSADLDDFRKWVTAVLAHEACHRMQHVEEPAKFLPGGEADDAAAKNQKYDSTRLPGDYVAYVLCPLEIEAHGAQLAAELRFEGQLDHDAFVAAAKTSSLMRHVKEKSTSEDGETSGQWDDLEATLTDEAWNAFKMMMGQ